MALLDEIVCHEPKSKPAGVLASPSSLAVVSFTRYCQLEMLVLLGSVQDKTTRVLPGFAVNPLGAVGGSCSVVDASSEALESPARERARIWNFHSPAVSEVTVAEVVVALLDEMVSHEPKSEAAGVLPSLSSLAVVSFWRYW